jgi:hypothetical protein
MVRPVEPEPPAPLRRVDAKVKRPDATPDKLAYQSVEERPRRGREQPGAKPKRSLPSDEVILHEAEEETNPEPSEPPEAPARSKHIDVEG